MSTRDADFEPWWEEKDLGAPPPLELEERIHELRKRAGYEAWVGRGMPLSEVMPDLTRPASGIGFAPGGMPVSITWVKDRQRVD